MTIGEKLKTLRRHRGLTHEALADRSGVGYALLFAYEAGRHLPSLRTLRRLGHALGVRLGEFENCELPLDYRSTATARG